MSRKNDDDQSNERKLLVAPRRTSAGLIDYTQGEGKPTGLQLPRFLQQRIVQGPIEVPSVTGLLQAPRRLRKENVVELASKITPRPVIRRRRSATIIPFRRPSSLPTLI